ncbi:basic proline-rich protein-like [Sphaerodactylus townsendi]|uniref:basic proline-rich protein-like n=1 Tax=Sphaerodactylus townsendi TaxID=933632 RepID=UPI002026F2D6|nr:basic proline-rich protein-like [Sphaerodactylus townsendi]
MNPSPKFQGEGGAEATLIILHQDPFSTLLPGRDIRFTPRPYQQFHVSFFRNNDLPGEKPISPDGEPGNSPSREPPRPWAPPPRGDRPGPLGSSLDGTGLNRRAPSGPTEANGSPSPSSGPAALRRPSRNRRAAPHDGGARLAGARFLGPVGSALPGPRLLGAGVEPPFPCPPFPCPPSGQGQPGGALLPVEAAGATSGLPCEAGMAAAAAAAQPPGHCEKEGGHDPAHGPLAGLAGNPGTRVSDRQSRPAPPGPPLPPEGRFRTGPPSLKKVPCGGKGFAVRV